jgi:hypothetical protein
MSNERMIEAIKRIIECYWSPSAVQSGPIQRFDLKTTMQAWLELREAAEVVPASEAAPKFKVGDRVSVPVIGTAEETDELGTIVSGPRQRESGWFYGVKVDILTDAWEYHEMHIKPSQPSEPHTPDPALWEHEGRCGVYTCKLKPGTLVRVKTTGEKATFRKLCEGMGNLLGGLLKIKASSTPDLIWAKRRKSWSTTWSRCRDRL